MIIIIIAQLFPSPPATINNCNKHYNFQWNHWLITGQQLAVMEVRLMAPCKSRPNTCTYQPISPLQVRSPYFFTGHYVMLVNGSFYSMTHGVLSHIQRSMVRVQPPGVVVENNRFICVEGTTVLVRTRGSTIYGGK